jgi:two-component system KDP operon response regulator KdpE
MATSGALILIVEDEPPMLRFLRATLGAHGYRLVECLTGAAGLAEAAARNPDVILLDLGLPDIDGIEVTRRLREWSRTPIIVISARREDEDKIRALDAGADDYLTKPFSVGELHARIRVAFRHKAETGVERAEPVFQTGELRVDLGKREVFVGEEEVHLAGRVQPLSDARSSRRPSHDAPPIAQEVWGCYGEHRHTCASSWGS